MIYLDNSATTRTFEKAALEVPKYMTDSFFNPSSAYSPAVEAERAVDKARANIAAAMGVKGTESMSVEEYRAAAIDAVKKLSADIDIPADLKAIVKAEDIPFLAQSAYDDACRPGNPRETSVEEITALYKSLI